MAFLWVQDVSMKGGILLAGCQSWLKVDSNMLCVCLAFDVLLRCFLCVDNRGSSRFILSFKIYRLSEVMGKTK